MGFRKVVSPIKRQQHYQFQAYLMKEKAKVHKNLKRKIFPTTASEDYDFFKILGEGSYGQVVAAQNIHDKKIFAVKVIEKKKLVNREILKHLVWEIRILNSVNFEFLISLECYFTNDCSVFLVLPYVSGGVFFKLLRRVKKFEEDTARFFVGQIILAIEYLHYMGIIYRDLKPENLLLDVQGYLKLIDYGFAKHTGHNYCYTFCGTPEYIAPEILLGKGYSLSPDWWTVGICLFEMCNGTPPFTSKNELKLFEKVLAGKIIWPEHFSSELKSILEGLLQVDRTKRLGCTKNKVEDIKFHNWFAPLDWAALWSKKLSSPVSFSLTRVTSDLKIEPVNYSFLNCKNGIPSKLIGNIDVSI